jgi:hypothetical protein
VSSYSGNYSVTIDNITTSFSALSSYNDSNALLFFATDLSQDVQYHTVVLTNTQNRTFGLTVGGMNVTTFGNATVCATFSSGCYSDDLTYMNRTTSSSSSSSQGTIAAIVLGAVLFVILACILMYWLFIVRPRTRLRKKQRSDPSHPSNMKMTTPQRIINISPPPGEEETDVASLSTSKGYGFGLGLQRTFPFFRKTKNGDSSNGHGDIRHSRSRSASHIASPHWERDDKRLSTNTLTVEFTSLGLPPESEKLGPGWANPITRTSFGSPGKGHTRVGSHRVALPELRVEDVAMEMEDVYDDDDADAKTLASRQDETIAATLSLSPRTSEAPGIYLSAMCSATIDDVVLDNEGSGSPSPPRDSRLLEVRETSPFRVDVGAILGQLKRNRDSQRTSYSGSSTWSRVRTRLSRITHRDDGKQGIHEEKPETPPETSSPESVPVVMLQSGSEPPPSEAAPASGTYSFLDFASSYSSLRRQSKTTTLSSAAAELGHSGDRTPWSDNMSMRMVRIEREKPSATTRPGPDAPCTVSEGSQTESPSDKSNAHSSPSTAPATHTTHGSVFPFPVTIPPSSHMPHPFNIDSQYRREREELQSLPPAPPVAQQTEVPPHSVLSPDTNSPTESVPFSVSDVHFRHSYSDYTDADSRRTSAASGLPPHPPLPSSQPNTPPPYIVQRVLGMTPVTSHTPAARLAAGPATFAPSTMARQVARPGTSPVASLPRVHYRTGSVIGPRPRPSIPGSSRGSPNLQLPLQGSWGGRGSRTANNNKPPSSPGY